MKPDMEVADTEQSIADQLHELRQSVHRKYGYGALKRLAEELGEPYVEVCKALGEKNAERIRQIEEVVADE